MARKETRSSGRPAVIRRIRVDPIESFDDERLAGRQCDWIFDARS